MGFYNIFNTRFLQNAIPHLHYTSRAAADHGEKYKQAKFDDFMYKNSGGLAFSARNGPLSSQCKIDKIRKISLRTNFILDGHSKQKFKMRVEDCRHCCFQSYGQHYFRHKILGIQQSGKKKVMGRNKCNIPEDNSCLV